MVEFASDRVSVNRVKNESVKKLREPFPWFVLVNISLIKTSLK